MIMRNGEERNLTTSVRGRKVLELNSPSSYIGEDKKKEGRDNGPNSNRFEGGVEDQTREMDELFRQ